MKELIRERIAKLRQQMKTAGVNAWYVSGTDPHLSEYLPKYWQIRSYLTGFTGSAGLVVITENEAALWTDSRYFLQAEEQLSDTGIQLMKMRIDGTPTPAEWLGKLLQKGDSAGVDASCLSVSQFKNLQFELFTRNLQLVNTGDLISNFWTERKPLPKTPIFEHELEYAGLSRLLKIDQIKQHLNENGAAATLITALDDLAWTFNLRGQDIDFNPVFVGYGLITNESTSLFISNEKVTDVLQQKLESEGIQLKEYEAIFGELQTFKGTLLVDPDRTNQALIESLSSDTEVINQISVPTLLKALKSEHELANIRKTMRLDGVAMIDFLFWLDQNIGKQTISEYDIAMQLEHFRSLQQGFMGISFFPIVGYNETGAIVHRSVTKETACEVKKEGMLLFDSGGQYLTGTTDITRTVILAEPSQQQKTDFTLVLKGVIAMTEAQFPAGTKGCNLDILARKAMWENGMNYGHGTCHGIGYFLNVHEGPMSIRQEYNEHPIKPGMVLSNEPAFYREGQYGLRTENMMVCVEKEKTEYGQFYGFETLTLCPIDLNLIDTTLLSSEEIYWIDNYHQWCFNELAPLVDNEKKSFLERITRKLN